MIEEEIMPATILAAAAAFVCTPIAVWDGDGPIWGQDIERAQIYAKRLCAHLWVDSMRRRLQHSKGIHRTVVASPLVAEPAYRQRRDSAVRHLRKNCLGNTFQHEAVSIRDMAKDFG